MKKADTFSFAEFASGKVRAAKLVYKVSETGDVVAGREATIKAPELGSKW
jgi:hypothetical protein